MPATALSLKTANEKAVLLADIESSTKKVNDDKTALILTKFVRDIPKEQTEKLKALYNAPKFKTTVATVKKIHDQLESVIQITKMQIAANNSPEDGKASPQKGSVLQKAAAVAISKEANKQQQAQTQELNDVLNKQLNQFVGQKAFFEPLLESQWGAAFDMRCPGFRAQANANVQKSSASVGQVGTTFNPVVNKGSAVNVTAVDAARPAVAVKAK